MVVDHDKNKNRIVSILLADSTVFDSGATTGLLREIFVGRRAPKAISGSNAAPFLYVTNGNPILTKRPKGIVQSNAQTYYDVTVRYNLNFIVRSKDKIENAESLLDDLELLISTSLENNFQLLNPTSSDDAICISSYIERVDSVQFSDKKGHLDQGRTITLNLSVITT